MEIIHSQDKGPKNWHDSTPEFMQSHTADRQDFCGIGLKSRAL